jgi:hypothetical protein
MFVFKQLFTFLKLAVQLPELDNYASFSNVRLGQKCGLRIIYASDMGLAISLSNTILI